MVPVQKASVCLNGKARKINAFLRQMPYASYCQAGPKLLADKLSPLAASAKRDIASAEKVKFTDSKSQKAQDRYVEHLKATYRAAAIECIKTEVGTNPFIYLRELAGNKVNLIKQNRDELKGTFKYSLFSVLSAGVLGFSTILPKYAITPGVGALLALAIDLPYALIGTLSTLAVVVPLKRVLSKEHVYGAAKQLYTRMLETGVLPAVLKQAEKARTFAQEAAASIGAY